MPVRRAFLEKMARTDPRALPGWMDAMASLEARDLLQQEICRSRLDTMVAMVPMGVMGRTGLLAQLEQVRLGRTALLVLLV